MNAYSDETIALTVIVALLFLYLILFGIAIASYIMTSLSLYKIADRRQIKNPWLAWLPIGNYWIIGSIADDYDARNGIKRKWKTALITLSLIYICGFIVVYTAMIIMIIALDTLNVSTAAGPVLGIVVLYILLILILICGVSFTTLSSICMYKIFESTIPEKALKYMLLYLLVPIAGPICLLKCKDKGYPNPDADSEEKISDENINDESINSQEL